MSDTLAVAGKKPAGWFSRRHQTPEHHKQAVEAYGTRRERKSRRVNIARFNADHPMVDCMGCGTRHRQGRCFAGVEQLSDADQLIVDLFTSGKDAEIDPAGTKDDKSFMKSLKSKKRR